MMRTGFAVALWVWVGCGVAPELPTPPEETGELAASSAPLSPRAQVVDALQAAGLLTAAQQRELVALADEPVGALYVTPGVPSPTDELTFFFIESASVVDAVTDGMVRTTADGWSTTRDVDGSAFTAGGLRGVRFVLPARGVAGPLELAARLQLGGSTVWLNKGGANYRLDVLADVSLKWVGNLTAHQEGLRRAFDGGALYAGHPLTVEVDTYPMTPNVKATLYWSTDGQQTVKSAPLSLAALKVGSYANNARWSGSLPAAELAAGGNVELWVEVKGSKNTLWDSQQGSNYRAGVLASPKVTWAELGAFRFNKCRYVDGHCETGWFYGSGLAEPFSATPSDYQVYAAAPSLSVELYAPGVTDRGGPADGQGGFVRAEVYSPFFSGSPSGAWKAFPLSFAEVAGNNWRLKWDVRTFRAPRMPAIGVDCAVDGDYPFKIRLSTDGGKSWQWLGTGALPSGGSNRTMRWANLSFAPQLSQDGSTLFTGVPVGSSRTRSVSFVNTNNTVVNVEKVAVDDPSGSFSVTAAACASLSSCNVALKAGERITLQLKYTAKQSDVQAQLHLTLNDTSQGCYGRGDFPIQLVGAPQ